MEIFYGLFFYLCAYLANGLPTQADNAPAKSTNASYFASQASQIIAANLLKHNIDIDANQVYSPLGVTSILAVLAEAAAGETYAEFNKALGYPEDLSQLRTSFKRILSRYNNRESSTEPSFQTWLYIYRNYTAREEFKQLLRDHYVVEVKDIDRDEYDWSEPNTSLDLESTTTNNSKDVEGFETLKLIKVDNEEMVAAASDRVELQDTYGTEVVDKPASKFDRVVDDKQYVEKPVILEEIKREQQKKQAEEEKKLAAAAINLVKKDVMEQEKEKEKQEEITAEDEKTEEIKEIEAAAADIAEIPKQEDELALERGIIKRADDMNFEDNETVQAEEKLHKHYSLQKDEEVVPIQDVLSANEPEKVSLPLQRLESALDAANKGVSDIMVALESHISSVRRALGARSLFRKDDITSALSANSITGREANSKTKMLLFNGLYYHGNWAHPFVAQNTNDEDFFFMTAEDAIKTPMMQASGRFGMADLQHLNAKAFCLPYENHKYTMLIFLPNDADGLRSVIEKMQPNDIEYAKMHMQRKELRITMPRFQVDETTRSEAMLKNLGLQKLFSRTEADLSRLSDDPDLHVDEIVQFVSVRVDETGSSENSLSAAATKGRTSETELEHIEINRPFLYFVMDCDETFVIVAGKMYAPEVKEELPISIEVEFQQT